VKIKRGNGRHIIECKSHQNSIVNEEDMIEHESLRKEIQSLMVRNREVSKKKDHSVERRKAEIKF